MQRFTKQAFLVATEPVRTELCVELGAYLLARINASHDFHATVYTVVAELRALGHDLWSFDESDDTQTWCPNWARPSGPGIVVVFSPDAVNVEWSA